MTLTIDKRRFTSKAPNKAGQFLWLHENGSLSVIHTYYRMATSWRGSFYGVRECGGRDVGFLRGQFLEVEAK